MAAPPSTGMDRAEMKALLTKATPEKPISFAFGLGKDPNLVLLTLDKLKNPKAVDKMLGDKFADLKASRFGTVSFDETDNLLKFLVNKPIGNVAAKLVKTLKGTGFAKVQIVLEDGTIAEEAGGEEDSEAGTDSQAASPPAGPDHAALVAQLTALVRAIPTAGPAAKPILAKLAVDANTHLKAEDLAGTAAVIAQMRAALQPGGTPQHHLKDLAMQASVLPEPARTALLSKVRQLVSNPDPGALAALANEVVEATKAARLAEAKQQAGNTVSFRLLQKKWLAAETQAEQQFGAFLDALLGDPELQADERYPGLQAVANDLEDLLPEDGGALTAALGQLDDADDAQRPKAQKQAMAALAAYRKNLDAAHELATLQGLAEQFYGKQTFFSGLQATVADLGAELAKPA